MIQKYVQYKVKVYIHPSFFYKSPLMYIVDLFFCIYISGCMNMYVIIHKHKANFFWFTLTLQILFYYFFHLLHLQDPSILLQIGLPHDSILKGRKCQFSPSLLIPLFHFLFLLEGSRGSWISSNDQSLRRRRRKGNPKSQQCG